MDGAIFDLNVRVPPSWQQSIFIEALKQGLESTVNKSLASLIANHLSKFTFNATDYYLYVLGLLEPLSEYYEIRVSSDVGSDQCKIHVIPYNKDISVIILTLKFISEKDFFINVQLS